MFSQTFHTLKISVVELVSYRPKWLVQKHDDEGPFDTFSDGLRHGNEVMLQGFYTNEYYLYKKWVSSGPLAYKYNDYGRAWTVVCAGGCKRMDILLKIILKGFFY